MMDKIPIHDGASDLCDHTTPIRMKNSDLLRSRRDFLKTAGVLAGGFSLGFAFDGTAATLVGHASVAPAADEAALTAYVRITPANEITLIVSQAEMGQGISTTLAAALCDELGADWESVAVRTAPFAPDYRNPRTGFMFTGNSESISSLYEHVRRMGAAARILLMQAAAARWNVAVTECEVAKAFVIHRPSGRRFAFGDVAADAARLPLPQTPTLKPDKELALIGRSLPRIDVPDKVAGTAIFGIDFQVPEMLTAAVRTAPAVGGGRR